MPLHFPEMPRGSANFRLRGFGELPASHDRSARDGPHPGRTFFSALQLGQRPLPDEADNLPARLEGV